MARQILNALYVMTPNSYLHLENDTVRVDVEREKKLYVPAHKLFELIQAKKNSEEPARDFSDYAITVDDAHIPAGVSLLRKMG